MGGMDDDYEAADLDAETTVGAGDKLFPCKSPILGGLGSVLAVLHYLGAARRLQLSRRAGLMARRRLRLTNSVAGLGG